MDSHIIGNGKGDKIKLVLEDGQEAWLRIGMEGIYILFQDWHEPEG
jgi:hypothetical protein